MDALILPKVTSKRIETHLKYVSPFYAMDGAPAYKTGHLISRQNPLQRIPHTTTNGQGCHWSGKSQGNSRSGKSQRILEFVREIWNFVEIREIQEKSGKFKKIYIS